MVDDRRRYNQLTRLAHSELVDLFLRLEARAETTERELAALNDEQDELDTILAQLRSCLDRDCLLCKQCVTRLWLRAKPTALTLPRKYVDHHRPQDCPACRHQEALQRAG